MVLLLLLLIKIQYSFYCQAVIRFMSISLINKNNKQAKHNAYVEDNAISGNLTAQQRAFHTAMSNYGILLHDN